MDNLNNTLHTQAKQWAELGRDPSKFAEVDIKQAIEDINPQLTVENDLYTHRAQEKYRCIASRRCGRPLPGQKQAAAMLISARSDGTCPPTMQLSTALYPQ